MTARVHGMEVCVRGAGARVEEVLGRNFVRSTRGQLLVGRTLPWLDVCETAIERLLELVSLQRLVQVYRAALRVERQVVPAAYELHTAALLADVVRALEFDVVTQASRRADLRAHFLSRTFHVEVKTHEVREGSVARPRAALRGGVRVARALLQAAERQASPVTANLVVLGRVEPAAVRRLAAAALPGGRIGALVWLDLAPRARTWRAQLHPLGAAARPFPPALVDVLEHLFGER